MSQAVPCKEVLDEPTLMKLKQHNRSIYQQKKQEALALRQKLEQWKEERRQKKMQEQKKVPFVTTVLKPALGKPPEKACTVQASACKAACRAVKPVCGPVKPVCGLVKPVCGPVKPVCGPVKSRANVKQPVAQRPAYGPVKKLANVMQIMPAQKSGKKGAEGKERLDSSLLPLNHQTRAGKENMVVTRSKTPLTARRSTRLSKGKGSASTSDCSKLSTSEMTTPLSRNSGFGTRHTITNLTARENEGQESFHPLNLADELQAAFSASQVIASESTTESMDDNGSTKTWEDTEKVAGLVGLSTEKPTHKASVSSAPAPVKTRSTPRDSLTAQFLKSKSQNKAAKKNSVPKGIQPASRASVAKKGSSLTSIRPAKPTVVSNPPRSILKRKSCGSNFRSSALGASPLLPAASSFKTERKTSRAGIIAKKAAVSAHGVDCETASTDGTRGATGMSGHVTFAVEIGNAGSEGASFRKTPGKCKSQEYMRLRLNEWLAAKGHTPSGIRHTGCFGCEAQACRQRTPRSQVKASMSVEQLTRQESTLAKEDTGTTTPRHWPSASNPPPPFRLSLTPDHTTQENTAHQPSPRLANTGCNTSEMVAETQNSIGDRSLEGAHQDAEVDKSEAMEVEDHGMEAEGAAGVSMEMEASPSSGRAELGLQTGGTEQLEKDLEKCLVSINSGSLSAEAAVEWLDLVGEACDEVRRHVGWYRCKVAALKICADEDALLAVFEQAIIHNAQPAAEMAQLLTDTMRGLLSAPGRIKRRHQSATSFRPSADSTKRLHSSHRASYQPAVHVENMFHSTMVKYSVVEVTPFKKRRRATDTEEALISVITPVRRSARFSTTRTASASEGRLPPGTPRVTEYSALGEVPSEEREHMLFHPNQALEPLLRDESPEIKRLSLDEAL